MTQAETEEEGTTLVWKQPLDEDIPIGDVIMPQFIHAYDKDGNKVLMCLSERKDDGTVIYKTVAKI